LNFKKCNQCKRKLSENASRYGTTGFCRSCWDKKKKGKQPNGGFIKGICSWDKGKHWNKNIKDKIRKTKTGISWGKHTEKTKKLLSLLKLGKKNPAYINGTGYKGYSLEFVNIRPKILKRDNYTCSKCGQYGTKNHNILTVHHIDYNKGNNKKSNLITLCQKCNSQVNSNRDYWYAYFIYIIREKRESKIE